LAAAHISRVNRVENTTDKYKQSAYEILAQNA